MLLKLLLLLSSNIIIFKII